MSASNLKNPFFVFKEVQDILWSLLFSFIDDIMLIISHILNIFEKNIIFPGQKMSKLYFSITKITPTILKGLQALTTGHPPYEQAPASGQPAILTNFRDSSKKKLSSGGGA